MTVPLKSGQKRAFSAALPVNHSPLCELSLRSLRIFAQLGFIPIAHSRLQESLEFFRVCLHKACQRFKKLTIAKLEESFPPDCEETRYKEISTG
jgi:hypothetical protein